MANPLYWKVLWIAVVVHRSFCSVVHLAEVKSLVLLLSACERRCPDSHEAEKTSDIFFLTLVPFYWIFTIYLKQTQWRQREILGNWIKWLQYTHLSDLSEFFILFFFKQPLWNHNFFIERFITFDTHIHYSQKVRFDFWGKCMGKSLCCSEIVLSKYGVVISSSQTVYWI